MEAVRNARGRVAVSAPQLPRAEINPARVAKRRGGYQIAAIMRLPISMPDMPSPVRPRPRRAVEKSGAEAKRRLPNPPMTPRKVMTGRRPIKSRAGPRGIWARAKT